MSKVFIHTKNTIKESGKNENNILSKADFKEPIEAIRNVREYKSAIKLYEELVDNYKETDDLNDYLDVLAMLIDYYENKKYPVEDADPVDIMKFLMEEKNIKQIELAKAFGSQ